ncbi:MAG: UbiA family prenyltransferase, partial [Marinosulfonomonas sp.]|nr:UbiA family prenyltransferase [Marinosulfonomonas sp.]
DTIYAHQDKEDDALIGVKSTARLFGSNTHVWLRWFMVAIVLLLALAIVMALAPGRNVLALTVALGGPWAMGWHLSWQNRALNTESPGICLMLFRANRNTGLLPALFLAISLFL